MDNALDAPLVLGGTASAAAALLHVAIIVGGERWYLAFGANMRMVEAAINGRWEAVVVTLAIACVLILFSLYAFSGAGWIEPLPGLKFALVVITAIYLGRALLPVPLVMSGRLKLTRFVVWSSLICGAKGGLHVVGLVRSWSRL